MNACVPGLMVMHADLAAALLRAAERVYGPIGGIRVISNSDLSRDQLEELIESEVRDWADGGVLFMGDKGVLMCGCYGIGPVLLPEQRMKETKAPAKTIERIPDDKEGHEKDWARACKTGKPACSNFEYSGPLSEMVLLGNLAVRNPDTRLLWDGPNMKVTNDTEADAYVRRNFREGWTL